ncbi:iron complex transport system substrate-binding protein [Fontibacillus phaseoli]|uniref:Iron complex transport system substrate-binding protein n=1 Tax=Fontibacillus phaseoli TaxID=1416533 RepID=A0A369BGJ8_9BACL|nr:iron-siderophore ABC transporter substrate-binding protein [Fontibacillus phaseoli]RCX20680.1 iron complex transport system substrate-binding protein [Fontibacillus phaseoli]
MKSFNMIMALILALAVAGCTANSNSAGTENRGTEGGNTAKSVQAAEGEATGGDGGQGPRTIEHALGTVTLEKKPERVVVLFNGMVDITAALEVKPVGAVESWEQKPWYEFLRDKMEGVKDLGEENQPNLEAIVALKPDLIIGTKTRHEKIYPQLKDIAPTLITEEIFDWKDNLEIGAKALYMDEEAAKLIADWDDRVADFKTKAGDSLKDTEVSIVRFEKDGSARFYVTGFAGTIFQELGIGRPEAQRVEGKAVVNLTSKEQMAQLDGDYIFDITRISPDDPSTENTRNDWTSHPLWSTLNGVKNGKHIEVDVITWNLSGGVLAANSMLDDVYAYFDIK